jgi:hypothetical protein
MQSLKINAAATAAVALLALTACATHTPMTEAQKERHQLYREMLASPSRPSSPSEDIADDYEFTNPSQTRSADSSGEKDQDSDIEGEILR